MRVLQAKLLNNIHNLVERPPRFTNSRVKLGVRGPFAWEITHEMPRRGRAASTFTN